MGNHRVKTVTFSKRGSNNDKGFKTFSFETLFYLHIHFEGEKIKKPPKGGFFIYIFTILSAAIE